MSGRVKRFACWPTLTVQTVGEHCWQVYRVYAAVFGVPRGEVAYYVMNHDSAELIVGDPPFPIKRNNPDLKAAHDRIEPAALRELGVEVVELSETERHRVKVCDLLEMMSFGMAEVEMGNRLAVPIVQRTHEAVRDYARGHLEESDQFTVLRYVSLEWRHHQSVLAAATDYVREAAALCGVGYRGD